MSAETLRRIYDPFFTTKGTPKEGQRKGTGLGLAVTYGSCRSTKARLRRPSVEGEGTAFRLEFPVADAGKARSESVQDGKAVSIG